LSKGNLFSDTTLRERAKSLVETDPIAFLVRFANADLHQFREGDWLNLLDDLAAFARWTRLSGPMNLRLAAIDEPGPRAHEPTLFIGLQQAIRNLLRRVAESQSVLSRPPVQSGGFDLVKDVAVSVEARRGETPALVFLGGFLNLLFIKAAVVLATEASAGRLRLCPECESLFLRVRKQQYCSRRCVNRANMRTWLKSKRGKASHRASSTRSYDKRKRARTSPNVTVAGRKVK